MKVLPNITYLRAIVIVHGKSEKQMCDFIKSKLRLNIKIISDKKGEKSIQITSLKNILNNSIFKTKNDFFRNFEEAIIINEKGKSMLPDDFKIFIIMDTDDCSEQLKNRFINKEMFSNHWAYSYIHSIYNSPHLESVLIKSNIKFKKEGKKRKEEYIKIFPTDPKYQRNDTIQIEEFMKNLRSNPNTNMDEFIEFCINISKSNNIQIN